MYCMGVLHAWMNRHGTLHADWAAGGVEKKMMVPLIKRPVSAKNLEGLAVAGETYDAVSYRCAMPLLTYPQRSNDILLSPVGICMCVLRSRFGIECGYVRTLLFYVVW